MTVQLCPECGEKRPAHNWGCPRLSDAAILSGLTGEGWDELVEGEDY